MMTKEQFYSQFAEQYQAHSATPADERNTNIRTWLLATMQDPTQLEEGVFEMLSSWYKLLSEQN